MDWVEGGYEFDPSDDADHNYTLCSEATVAATHNCEQVVGSETRPDLCIGNNGLGEQVAETLLEKLAYWLIRPYLGIVGRIIANTVLSWVIDLDLRRNVEDNFPADPFQEYTISTTFPAYACDVYNFSSPYQPDSPPNH